MPSVRYSRIARNDLRDIWCWIAIDDRVAAEQLVAAIERRCDVLRRFPMLGSPRSDLGARVRLLTFGKFVVLYSFSARGVLVKRVVRATRDLVALQDH